MCITPKINGATFTRPNGSGGGIKALSDAFNSVGWTGSTYTDSAGVAHTCSAANISLSGLVDFARSSSGPAGSSNNGLTWVPFARDAVSFAYYNPGSATTVTSLTKAQLTALYTSSSGTILDTATGTTIGACSLQGNSGTWKFFFGAAAFTDTQVRPRLSPAVATPERPSSRRTMVRR
jgi:hypothetical protein